MLGFGDSAGCDRADGDSILERMRRWKRRQSSSFFAAKLGALLLLPAIVARADDIPLEDEKDHTLLISLGPIGARVLTDDLKGDTYTSDSHADSGTVKFIYPGSLAVGRLQLEDKIVGIDGKKFSRDFSRRVAAAIDEAEGGSGKLALDVERGGKAISVPFGLQKIGSLSPTYPYDCKKSDLILESACDWLARHVDASGRLDQGGSIVESAVGGLALLGSGYKKYAPITERLAGTLVRFFGGDGRPSAGQLTVGPDGFWPGYGATTWQVAYGAFYLSEYYLATGDARVLKTLAHLNVNLERRQFRSAPKSDIDAAKNGEVIAPYWFGHDAIRPEAHYQHLGVNTANALLAWDGQVGPSDTPAGARRGQVRLHSHSAERRQPCRQPQIALSVDGEHRFQAGSQVDDRVSCPLFRAVEAAAPDHRAAPRLARGVRRSPRVISPRERL